MNNLQLSDNQLQYSISQDQQTTLLDNYQKILQCAEIGRWEIDLEQRIARGCETSNFFLGISGNGITIREFWKKLGADDRVRLREQYRTLQTTGQIKVDVKILSFGNLYPIWIRIVGVAVKRPGPPAVLQGVLQNVTENYSNESVASELLSFANHEIRSSLSTLKLFIQQSIRMLARSDRADTESLLSKADEKINAITQLTTSFLDSSAITAVNLGLQTETFNLSDLLHEIASEFRFTNPAYYFLVLTSCQVGVKADRLKLCQAITNLVNNAVKYSASGTTITMICEVQIDGIRVTVRDQGIGIPENEKNRIFGKFYRIADRKNKAISGYGVGLYFFKKVIECHNGTVGVLSRPKKGTEFYFKLPASRFWCAG
ncbi:PAS domain-containing sensor histidine kinase [Mucilaginibacter rubeus]|uniref:PAS domain-containing sensor histidine kinase n=1 Tax=Mucilaginibacter rubeus TaxID=2027860 RepID=UPI0016640BF1|nr:HAMP domain-containing sensor histidine kinase [Mucilaginibacter rubeus]GGA96125.1 hypothetical protein GCM10011500_09890 [Mucilaginibacter rubeus]